MAGILKGSKAAKEGAEGVLDYLIKAWHGSAKDFDKFSDEFIGTGEGAQAFGFGHYAADQKGIAKYYRDMLTRDADSAANYSNDVFKALKNAGVNRELDDAFDLFSAQLLNNSGDLNRTIADTRKQIRMYQNDGDWTQADDLEAIVKDFEKAVDKGLDIPKPNKGKIYELGIKSSPDELLDWDKPINEQPPAIRQALLDFSTTNEDKILSRLQTEGSTDGFSLLKEPDGRFYAEVDNGLSNEWKMFDTQEQAMDWIKPLVKQYADNSVTGAQVYRNLTDRFGGQNLGQIEASKFLSDKGIKGIKYFDGMSRDSMDGSRNYVVFDPNNIEIINKYLRPETVAATGLLANIQGTPESQASDLASYNQGVTLDSYMSQLGADKKPDIYNYGKTFPIKRNKVTGDYSYATTGILEEMLRGFLDVGESRKSGVVTNQQSMLDAFM